MANPPSSGVSQQTTASMTAEISKYLDDQSTRDGGRGSMWTPKSRLVVVTTQNGQELQCTNSLIKRFCAEHEWFGYSFDITAFGKDKSSDIQAKLTDITTHKSRLGRIHDLNPTSIDIEGTIYVIKQTLSGTVIQKESDYNSNSKTGLFIRYNGTEAFDGDENCRTALIYALKLRRSRSKRRT